MGLNMTPTKCLGANRIHCFIDMSSPINGRRDSFHIIRFNKSIPSIKSIDNIRTPSSANKRQALDVLMEAIEKSGHKAKALAVSAVQVRPAKENQGSLYA